MNNLRLTYLFEKQVSKNITTLEEGELKILLADHKNEEEVKALFESAWINFKAGENVFSALQSEKMLKHILQKEVPVKLMRIWTRYMAAAIVLISLSTGLYFLGASYFEKSNIDQIANTKHDLNPGSNKAKLTLANGKVIDLNSKKNGVIIDASKLSYNDGTAIPVESLAQEELSITTPRGGTYQVTLPDGTLAWLNASSTLKFPASFAEAKTRSVSLIGEAYFEIKHNATQPFVVRTLGQITEDIGTAFNLNSYADETVTKTTLLEGSIKVNNTTLIPGQQSSFSIKEGLNVAYVNAEEAIDWKNGEFVLKNDNLKSIMRKISRWYDVDVVFQDANLEKETFSGSVSRYGRVSEILKTLELTDRVHFKVEGRKVTVIN